MRISDWSSDVCASDLGPYSGAAERAGTADKAVEAGAIASARRVFLNELPDLPQPLEFGRIYDAMNDPARRGGRRAVIGDPVTWVSWTSPTLTMAEALPWAAPQPPELLAAMIPLLRYQTGLASRRDIMCQNV